MAWGLGDAFRDNLKYQFMVGGQFIFHPGGKIDYGINIIDKKDPITKDIGDFSLKNTEQYYMLVEAKVDSDWLRQICSQILENRSYP